MSTAQDLIEGALRKIAVLGYGSSLSNEEAQDGLSALNAMLASWSVDNATIYTESKLNNSWAAGTGSKTIGSGGDIDTTRPTDITAATYTIGTTVYKLDIRDEKERAMLADLTTQGTPSELYYDADYPLANIYLQSIPNTAGTLNLYYRIPLTSFALLTTTFAFPPEYEEALIYNLAIRLAPEYEKEPAPSVIQIANKSLDMVKRQNTKNEKNVSLIDSALTVPTSFNIYTRD